MLQVTIDSPAQVQGCMQCCCESVSLKPGEIQPLHINYAHWAVPIGQLHCETAIEVEEKRTCATPDAGNLPPASSVDHIIFSTGVNMAVTGDLTTWVKDPEGQFLTFKALTLYYGPRHGTLTLRPDGTFDYVPQSNYQGADRFFASASDGISDPFIFEVMFAVGIDPSRVKPTPYVAAGKPIIDQRFYRVTIPIGASPAAKTCQIFRLNLRQGALDCECNCYYHNSCVDVKIVKC